MGLQLRLTDALGEPMLELDARPPDRANIVGRAADADVEVPSSSVNNRHCLLFVRDGRWFVQDAGSGDGTFLNGKRLSAPATINSGDTITLGAGSNPPTITIDPHHAGVSENADENWIATPPPPSVPRAPWRQPVLQSPAPPLPPPVARQPGAMPAYVRSGYAAPPVAQQEPESSGWEDVPPPTTHYYVPKPKRTSPGVIALFAVLSIGIAAGGCYWLYIAYQKRMVSSSESIVPTPTTKESPQPSSVFDFADGGSATQPTTRVTPAPPTTVQSSAATEAPPDKRRQDPEWVAIEQARFEEPVLSIVKFNDYLDRFPNTPFKKDLEQYTNEAVDRLWWKRLMDLFHERDAAMKEIADRKLQLSQSQDPEFKKGLETEVAGFAERRDRADETIRLQMKYTSQSPPNLYDSQELAILRANRDAAYYATWSEQVISTIKHSRGQRLPWGSTR